MKMDFDWLWTTLDIDPGRLFDVFKYDPQAPMIFNSGIFLWLFAGWVAPRAWAGEGGTSGFGVRGICSRALASTPRMR